MSLKKKQKKMRELKGPSLTVKWAFASSFFIFVVFTIFAGITYKTSINLIVAKEENNVEQTMSEVVSRLANANEELTLVRTYHNLTKNESGDTSIYDRTSTIDGNLMKIDTFISELGEPSMNMFVYNLNEKLIFKTHEEDLKLMDTQQKAPTIITLNGVAGFLSIQPVFSKRTQEKIGYVQSFYELTAFYKLRSKLLLTLIILEIISLILSSILGFFLSTYFLRPLKVLRDTMETVRKNPQSTVRMPEINTNDELTDLAEIFNEMLDRMHLFMEQQERFVEDVSHELRTPVAIIEGHLNLLNRWGKNDPEILEESLSASMQEISRMKTLVQEMLDLSRAEQVDMQYANETTQAKEVVYQVFDNFKILYPEFVFTLDDDLNQEKILKIYRNHFEQILIIVLDNAVKYSTDRKEVHLSISADWKNVQIAIQDFGEGIAPEDTEKIFHRFYRVDQARARTKGGNGLGLSIARQLLDSYKGKITAESALGQGTIFRILVPILREKEL